MVMKPLLLEFCRLNLCRCLKWKVDDQYDRSFWDIHGVTLMNTSVSSIDTFSPETLKMYLPIIYSRGHQPFCTESYLSIFMYICSLQAARCLRGPCWQPLLSLEWVAKTFFKNEKKTKKTLCFLPVISTQICQWNKWKLSKNKLHPK